MTVSGKGQMPQDLPSSWPLPQQHRAATDRVPRGAAVVSKELYLQSQTAGQAGPTGQGVLIPGSVCKSVRRPGAQNQPTESTAQRARTRGTPPPGQPAKPAGQRTTLTTTTGRPGCPSSVLPLHSDVLMRRYVRTPAHTLEPYDTWHTLACAQGKYKCDETIRTSQ